MWVPVNLSCRVAVEVRDMATVERSCGCRTGSTVAQADAASRKALGAALCKRLPVYS